MPTTSPAPVQSLPATEGAGLGTRERIVVAAADAFAIRGYHGVNLNDVVTGLGLTKGALYYFFPTKEALAREIARRHVELFDQLGGASLPRDRNRLDEVIELSYRACELFVTNPITRAGTRLTVERATVNFDLPRPFVSWIERITKLLRQAKTRGELAASVNVKGAGEVIVDQFFGAQLVSSELTDREDLRSRLDRFWDLVEPSLRPEER